MCEWRETGGPPDPGPAGGEAITICCGVEKYPCARRGSPPVTRKASRPPPGRPDYARPGFCSCDACVASQQEATQASQLQVCIILSVRGLGGSQRKSRNDE